MSSAFFLSLNALGGLRMSEWISVDDDRISGDYLCIRNDGSISVCTYYQGIGWGTGSSHEITHWMPLPEPPNPNKPKTLDRMELLEYLEQEIK